MFRQYSCELVLIFCLKEVSHPWTIQIDFVNVIFQYMTWKMGAFVSMTVLALDKSFLLSWTLIDNLLMSVYIIYFKFIAVFALYTAVQLARLENDRTSRGREATVEA